MRTSRITTILPIRFFGFCMRKQIFLVSITPTISSFLFSKLLPASEQAPTASSSETFGSRQTIQTNRSGSRSRAGESESHHLFARRRHGILLSRFSYVPLARSFFWLSPRFGRACLFSVPFEGSRGFSRCFRSDGHVFIFALFHVAFGTARIRVGNGEITSTKRVLRHWVHETLPVSEVDAIVAVTSGQQGGTQGPIDVRHSFAHQEWPPSHACR